LETADSLFGFRQRRELDDTRAWVVLVDIGPKDHVAAEASVIFEVLPASRARNPGHLDSHASTWWTSSGRLSAKTSTATPVIARVVEVSLPWVTRRLDGDVFTHEVSAIGVTDTVFSITCRLVLDEAEATHRSDIGKTTELAEEILDVSLGSS